MLISWRAHENLPSTNYFVMALLSFSVTQWKSYFGLNCLNRWRDTRFLPLYLHLIGTTEPASNAHDFDNENWSASKGRPGLILSGSKEISLLTRPRQKSIAYRRAT